MITGSSCSVCGGDGGVVGPCPECGALPPVGLVGVETQPSDTERRVTTPRTARRGAVCVIGVLVALVVASIVWGGGGSEVAGGEDPAGDDAEAATTSTTRPRRSTTTLVPRPAPRPADDEPAVLAEPVEGFGGQFLILLNTQVGSVWQLALDGGEAIQLGTISAGGLGYAQHLVGDHLVGPEGGVSLRDGSTWRVEREPLGGWSWVVGLTGSGTLVTFDEQQFLELGADGVVVAERAAPDAGAAAGWPRAVVGRQVLYEGPHGLITFDLDTGVLRRLVIGAYLASAGDLALVEICDDDVRCRLHLLDTTDGRTVAEHDSAIEGPSSIQNWLPAHLPAISPDGQRIALLGGDTVELVERQTGRRVGTIDLPEHAVSGTHPDVAYTVGVVWSPDSQAGLVFVARNDGRSEERGVRFAAVFDRDLAQVVPRDDLAAALSTSLRFGGMPGFFLSAEGFEVWGR